MYYLVNWDKMKKGFTYIITTMILIVIISSIIIINATTTTTISKHPIFLSENYENEFLILNQNNVNENRINTFNSSFIEYINSYNLDVELCNIIDDGNNLYFSNYTGNTCALIIDGKIDQEINNNTTIKRDRFINEMNIYLCNCNYYVGENKYHISISGEYLKIVKEN